MSTYTKEMYDRIREELLKANQDYDACLELFGTNKDFLSNMGEEERKTWIKTTYKTVAKKYHPDWRPESNTTDLMAQANKCRGDRNGEGLLSKEPPPPVPTSDYQFFSSPWYMHLIAASLGAKNFIIPNLMRGLGGNRGEKLSLLWLGTAHSIPGLFSRTISDLTLRPFIPTDLQLTHDAMEQGFNNTAKGGGIWSFFKGASYGAFFRYSFHAFTKTTNFLLRGLEGLYLAGKDVLQIHQLTGNLSRSLKEGTFTFLSSLIPMGCLYGGLALTGNIWFSLSFLVGSQLFLDSLKQQRMETLKKELFIKALLNRLKELENLQQEIDKTEPKTQNNDDSSEFNSPELLTWLNELKKSTSEKTTVKDKNVIPFPTEEQKANILIPQNLDDLKKREPRPPLEASSF